MKRRDFLARFLGTAAGAAVAASGLVDLERLAWTPGEKAIFIPEAIVPPNLTELLAFDQSAFGRAFASLLVPEATWERAKTLTVDAETFGFDREEMRKMVAHSAKLLAEQIDREALEVAYRSLGWDQPLVRPVTFPAIDIKLPANYQDWALRLNALGVPFSETTILVTDKA